MRKKGETVTQVLFENIAFRACLPILPAMTGLMLLLAATPAVTRGQSLAIRNVTVVDANGAREGQTVVIANGKITAVGRGIPAGAGAIDGKGKFLIPGLWDMHVHLWDDDPKPEPYVAYGVLGVRDMGSDLVKTRALRAPGRIAPKIYTSGQALDGPRSGIRASAGIKVAGPEEARQAVDKLDKGMADFIRILSGLSRDSYFSIAQRARVIRSPFAGHLPGDVTVAEAIDARQKSMEHMFGLPMAFTPLEPSLREQRATARAKGDREALAAVAKRVYETFSPGLANETFHRMARFGMWQCPTLTLWQRMERDKEASHEEYEFHARLVKLMYGAGTGVLAGTDTGDPGVEPGIALHDELRAMVAAGLSPLEALTTATLNPARFFEIEATHGTVAKGRTADLVLLEADPLADIGNTRRIAAVIRAGKLLDRKCLDSLAAGKTQSCPSVSSKTTPPGASSVKPRVSSRKPASRTR